jgi:uncharacterized protein DUF5683
MAGSARAEQVDTVLRESSSELAEVVPGHAAHAGTHADSTRHREPPYRVMLRSAVLPGWGQAYNGKYWKTVIVVGGEGFLIYKALQELGKENDAIALLSTLEPGTPEYDAAQEARDTHYNLKVNYIWWTIAAHLLQMADAYVDAHLADFEADLGPGTGPGDTRVVLAYRTRF